MKKEQTDAVVKNIKKAYKVKNSERFLDNIEEISDTHDIYIYIASFDGSTMYFKPSGDNTSSRYYANQIATVNEKLLESQEDSVSFTIDGTDDSKKILAYGNVLIAKNKTPLIVYTFSPLWPVSSTIQILTNQLVYVTFISLLLACCISFYLSGRITRPIRKIAHSAERLADGEYGIVFKGGHYTEINNLADTLTRASIELEKSDMLQKDLIANVSHDLRTPLTMIKSYAEMIKDISGNNPQKRDEHLQVIIDEADRLNGLVNDLLTISRMQSGKMTLHRHDFNITEAAQMILNTYRIMEEEEGYTFQLNAPANFIVNGDEDKIKQVISNLFTNAIKFCGEDKTVVITLKKRGRFVVCRVEDHGVGIAAEELTFSTTSGDFQAKALKSQNVAASTVSGNMNARFIDCPQQFCFDSTSGNCSMIIPQRSSLTVSYESVSGTFSDQFDGRRNDDGEYVIGQGKWNCNVTTVSGDLRISRFGI